MKLYIDFGGTNFRYKLDEGAITTLPSNNLEFLAFLEEILHQNSSIDAIHMSFAGLVKNGVIIKAPNIAIKNLDLKAYLSEHHNIALKIDNDLNCAALAEHNMLQHSSMALFYIGTGFGAAFMDESKIIRGANNQSGEIGHIPFKISPFTCGCGRNDCVELFCSGSAIEKWCEYYKIDKEFHRLEKLQTLKTPHAMSIVENFYASLSHAFHTALNLFDFSTLVLGGSVAKHEVIKEFLEEEFRKSAFLRESLEVRISTLENGSLEGTKYL